MIGGLVMHGSFLKDIYLVVKNLRKLNITINT